MMEAVALYQLNTGVAVANIWTSMSDIARKNVCDYEL